MQYTLEIYSDLHGISSARRWSVRALKCVILVAGTLLACFVRFLILDVNTPVLSLLVLCFLLFGFRVVRCASCAVL